MKLTDQGVRDIKNASQRIEQGIKTFEKMGGKILGFYAVTGEYDYISIGESPNDEIGMAFVLGLSAQGNVRITTIQAFTKEKRKPWHHSFELLSAVKQALCQLRCNAPPTRRAQALRQSHPSTASIGSNFDGQGIRKGFFKVMRFVKNNLAGTAVSNGADHSGNDF
jgi:uncharacterized protein with GYD domain